MAKKGRKNGAGIIKRFIGNKNTVTILGFFACIGVLVVGYNIRVREAISPQSVPYAKQTIPARTLITNDMLGRIKVSSSYISEATNLVKNTVDIVGKYVSYKTNIPRGSLFYSNALKDADEMPDAAFANIEDGYTIYYLSVNAETTYANSIRAGDYIDIYMSSVDRENNLVIYGKLIESIRVLAVKDSRGENILKNTLDYGAPAQLLFAVSDDMYLLLKQSEYIQDKVTLTPVIRNAQYTINAGETLLTSQQLQEFIKRNVTVLE